MDLSASLHITQKGVDEVKGRVYKLSIRKRSVLILLEKPQTVEYVLHKSVFHEDEVVEEINGLLRDGFIEVSGDLAVDRGPLTIAPPPQAAVNFHLEDDIVLSEAKFLLIDFCVDSFGTGSQVFVDEIRSCNSAKNLSVCLRNIHAAAEKQCPARIPALLLLIQDINETA